MAQEHFRPDDRVSVDAKTLEALRAAMRGPVIEPGDPRYDEARRVYNAMIDRRPQVIASCVDAADVTAAVNFARETGLLASVRGGGHNVAGLCTNDGGLLIDLSRMRGVRVDPWARTAQVEGGAVWGDVDHATYRFGLAVPSGLVSSTGVGGLALGGGHGYLTRTYGLTCDNLVSADVVTASGEFVRAGHGENEDLLWGLRGGGGNFGVVTSFEFAAHPVGMVLGGPLFYPIEMARDVLRFYRNFIAEVPDYAYAFAGFHIEPPTPFVPSHEPGTPLFVIVACATGARDAAEEALRPLREFGPPEADAVSWMPFPALQSMFDPILPPGLYHYWKGDLFSELSDQTIEAHLRHGSRVPAFQSTCHIYPINGAAQRVGKNDTAFSYREASFSTVIAGMYSDQSRTPDVVRWVRDYWSDLHPHSLGAAYVNFLMNDDGQERVWAAYRDNYDRLVALKNKYDPANLFRMNHNIRPTV